RGPDVKPYTPEGFWPDDLPPVSIFGAKVGLNDTVIQAGELAPGTQALYEFSGFTGYSLGGTDYAIDGTRIGNIHSYSLKNQGKELDERQFVVNEHGHIIRNPAVHSDPAYFQSPDGRNGLIVASEGGVYFYAEKGAK